MKKDTRFLALYLGISFGVCWGIALIYILFGEYVTPITGELHLMHPIAIAALYSPSIAGLITYYAMGGMKAVGGILLKLVPRKQDWFWFPIIFAIFTLFAASMHFGSKALGFEVPEITYTVPEMVKVGVLNLFKETGLIGGIFGWIGFLLPYLQRKLNNQIAAGLATGFLFGLWVLPGYIIASFGTTTSYIYYVIQLMCFVTFQTYIFNATGGNLLFYLISFWLAATGSQIQLYYFNPQVQILQISYFILATIVIYLVFWKWRINHPMKIFPDFILTRRDEAGHPLGRSREQVSGGI